ncbi:hypothetical protein GJ496_000802, partial [Pomphorhynchus laevis]
MNNDNANSSNASDNINLDEVDDVDSIHQQWIPYSKRPEWNDITPVEIDTPLNRQPIVEIAYSPQFKEVYDYLRAIVLKSEISERAFFLTEDAVLANPANYSAWYYRRQIIKEMNLDLNKELQFISLMILNNPKNYQVWEHRRTIVEWFNSKDNESEFLQQVFEQDDKNYHAWQYRQWLIRHFNMFDMDELRFCTAMISRDIRNNSAWNHRFLLFQEGILHFVVNGSDGEWENLKFSDKKIKKSEILFTLEQLKFCLNNESAWNYLRGIVDQNPYAEFEQIVEFCWNAYDQAKSVNDGKIDEKLKEKFDHIGNTILQSDPNISLMPATPFTAKLINIPLLGRSLHKGQCGRIGIVGGSTEYSGAPYFAGIASLRAGADYVIVMSHAEAAPAIKTYSPELIVHPNFNLDGLPSIKDLLKRCHAVVIGPGLGRKDEQLLLAKDIIIFATENISIPCVVDADAIIAIEKYHKYMHLNESTILTPNVNEYNYLVKGVLKESPLTSPDEIDNRDIDQMLRLSATLNNACILRKQQLDIICQGN